MKHRMVMFFLLIMMIWSHAGIHSVVEQYQKKNVELWYDLVVYWDVREREEKHSGHAFLTPGDKFNFSFDTNKWTSDGVTVWQYNSASNQVLIRDLLDVDLSMHPSTLFEDLLNKTFVETPDGANKQVATWVNPAPKRGEDRRIEVLYDKKKSIILSAVFVDEDGNINTYTFTKTRFPEQISEELFTFVIPEGADVLEN